MKIFGCFIYLSCASLIFLLVLTGSPGNAASVRQVSMDQMLQVCQFVFQGEVTAIETRENDQQRIHSYVTFRIDEVIKGQYPDDQITLSFLGGTVGGRTMAVSDMHLPKIGEQGIYFVESLERTQVNPLYGWSQGHFLVEADDTGSERVMTSSRQPIIEVAGDNIGQQTSTPPKAGAPALSKGVARGVVVAEKNKGQKGLPLDEFKKALRGRLRTVR